MGHILMSVAFYVGPGHHTKAQLDVSLASLHVRPRVSDFSFTRVGDPLPRGSTTIPVIMTSNRVAPCRSDTRVY